MSLFYLGIHHPCWLRETSVPLFVSHRRLCERKTLPTAAGRWALDSGGFSELSLFGCWTVGPEQYIQEVKRYSEQIGGLQWAAIQDWMCEPFLLEKTGLSVLEHQSRTIRSYLELMELAPELPWLPVLQGWSRDDYLRHVDAYGKAGVELRKLDLIGLGSVCRRQETKGVETLIRELAVGGLKLHGFGFKLKGLENVADALTSSDSMAWSFSARRDEPLPGCTHRNCANCLKYALRWRGRALESIEKCKSRPRQLSLF